MHKSAITILLASFALAIASSVSEAEEVSNQRAKNLCIARTGLKAVDIKQMFYRNNECAIDCVLKSGEVIASYEADGAACLGQEGYSCKFGQCRGPNEPDQTPRDLYKMEVRVKSALVPDMDVAPMTGDSDVFVKINVKRNGKPAYDDDETLCYTYVIQDNNRPKWKFTCKPLPMGLGTLLEFVIVDSDKPSENHDIIGKVERLAEDLMNKGSVKMTFGKNEEYYLEVEVIGKEYQP